MIGALEELLARASRMRKLAASGEARVLRESAGVSTRELGRRIGVSAATVSRWERGMGRPPIESAVRWEDALSEFRESGRARLSEELASLEQRIAVVREALASVADTAPNQSNDNGSES